MWARRIGTLLAVLLLSAVGTTAQEAAPDERTLTTLLGRKLSAAAVDENGWTDLHHAAVLNLTALAATLLDAGAAPNAALRTDREPLSERLQEVLTALGRDTFGNTHRYGQTPLHLAAREGSHDAAALLIDHGAAVNAKDVAGNTPLHYALSEDAGTTELAKLLIDASADVDARGEHGERPLHRAVGRLEALQLLLDAGAHPDHGDVLGRTPLHHAVAIDHVESVAALVLAGADPDPRDAHGDTPLHHAAHALHVTTPLRAAVRTLLALGADPRVRNDDGLTYEEVMANEVKSIEEFAQRATRTLCNQYKENNFPGLKRKLRNFGIRYLDRELTVEEIYPYLRCKVKSTEGLDLFRMSPNDPSLDIAFDDMLQYFDLRVEDKSLLGNILMCKRAVGMDFSMNIFEYLEQMIKEVRNESLRQRWSRFLRMLEKRFPEGRPECDPDFCRVYLPEQPRCRPHL